jgi:tripartite-type tricarboxylate transporter receptor subunit TctC
LESRGGATSTIGASYVARAAPDGYTLLLGTINEIAMSPTLYQSLPYDPTKAFAPVYAGHGIPEMLVVGADTPVKTLAELVAGTRQAGHAELRLVRSPAAQPPDRRDLPAQANVSHRACPHRGGGWRSPTYRAAHHGDVCDAALGDILIKGGKLRAGGDRPASIGRAPDGRLGKEAGMPDLVVTTWNGVLAPANTPPEVVERLHRAGGAVALTPLKEAFGALGAETELIASRGNSPTASRAISIAGRTSSSRPAFRRVDRPPRARSKERAWVH